MSREDTLAVLRGEPAPPVIGATWLPLEAAGLDAPQAATTLAASMHLDFLFVDANRSDAEEIAAALAAAGILAVWAVSGVVGRVARMRGWPEVMRYSAGHPERLVTSLAEALHEALEQIRTGIAVGVEAFVVADDLSSPAGWLVAPDFALDAGVPCYRNIAGEIARAGALAAFHSDGDVRALYGALAGAGFSAVHLAGIELAAVGEHSGAARAAGLVPIGGIPARALVQVETSEIAEEVEFAADAGPIAIADDGGIDTALELESFAEVLAQLRLRLGLG